MSKVTSKNETKERRGGPNYFIVIVIVILIVIAIVLSPLNSQISSKGSAHSSDRIPLDALVILPFMLLIVLLLLLSLRFGRSRA